MPAYFLAFEPLDWVVYVVAGIVLSIIGGWRYLLSPSYRRRTQERWKTEGQTTKVIQIICGVLGILLTLYMLTNLGVWLIGSMRGK